MSQNDALHPVVNSIRPMLQNMPGYHFVKDLNFRYVEISHDVASLASMKREHVIDKLDCELPWRNHSDLYWKNDQDVIKNGLLDVFEPLPIDSKRVFVTRSLKFAMHDQERNIMGIIGQTYLFSQKETMGEALKAIMLFDQKSALNSNKKYNAYVTSEYHPDFNLTHRETECLFLLIRGKTAKEIGKFLTISPRTVEVYVENIKKKMCVNSRSDIIDKAEKLGMLKVIPKDTVGLSIKRNAHQWSDFFNQEI